MDTKELLQRIEINPKKLVGKPVIRGTRIAVEQILRMLAVGRTGDEILLDFPQLTKEDIQATILYAAELVEDFDVYPRKK
ncbi:MAG: DUF433 domain-containing protein [Candidatus Magasanikbacteria bacterium]|nr:DUF433 domain-containing protein [Candidatus Magasanikbacteria bacterium]